MVDRYESAELLAALWKLGAGNERMPTSHGILDEALFQLRDELPDTLRAGLSFSVTGVGRRCLELPAILLAAQEALLTSEPNPTYLSTAVTLGEDSARQIVVGASISTKRARELGAKLLATVMNIRNQMGATVEPVAA